MFSNPRSYWKILLYVILTLVCFLLQSVPVFGVRFLGCAPSLLLLLTLGVAFFEAPAQAAVFGLIAGLLSQLMTATVVGFDAVFFMFAAFLISISLEFFLQRKFFVYFLVALLFLAVYLLLQYAFARLLADSLRFSVALVRRILPSFFFTGLFALPIYWILYRFDLKFNEKEDLA